MSQRLSNCRIDALFSDPMIPLSRLINGTHTRPTTTYAVNINIPQTRNTASFSAILAKVSTDTKDYTERKSHQGCFLFRLCSLFSRAAYLASEMVSMHPGAFVCSLCAGGSGCGSCVG